MRLPDFCTVTIEGVPFADAGGRAQSRYIATAISKHKAEAAKTDPGAVTPAERAKLDAAEARLAEVQAENEAAWAKFVAVKTRRWRAQTSTSLIDSVKRVTGTVPSEAEVAAAEVAYQDAHGNLQRTLMERNREYQRVDNARWFRRHGPAKR